MSDSKPATIAIAIGASAGGVTALRALIGALPDGLEATILVVQHLDPHRVSQLVEVIARGTKLRVKEAADGEPLEAGTIYIGPPKTHFLVAGGRVVLRDTELVHFVRPSVDVLFSSVAEAYGKRAIGVVLTGAGVDGASGMRDIKERGGATIVQDPAEASSPSMPQAAFATGIVDSKLPLAAIADRVVRIVAAVQNQREGELECTATIEKDEDREREPPAPAEAQEEAAAFPAPAPSPDGAEGPEEGQVEDRGFHRVLERLHSHHGFDFREYKEASLARRIRARMSQMHVDGFNDYVRYLDRHPNEYAPLIDTILINVTGFFRDPEAWQVLRRDVLPKIVDDAATSRNIRVWCAGCSSGEEAYSAGIAVAEALRERSRGYDVKIYATDVDEEALASARAGLYRLDQLKDVPSELVERYFTPDGQAYRVSRDIRRWCLFGKHDVAHDPPLSHVDLLICRNVLIYFDAPLQERTLPSFDYALRPHGFLFLGKSESLLMRSHRFQAVDFKWRIFQRTEKSELLSAPDEKESKAAGETVASAAHQATVHAHQLIDELATAVFVIDPADLVVTWNSACEALFEIPPHGALGRKFRDLDISYRVDGLRARVEEVKRTHNRARLDDVSFTRRNGEIAHAALSVSPLYEDGRRITGVLVSAQDVSDYARLRDEMNKMAEQYATANEELQSTNEELETTNEELQSTNEELETTIQELQSTNAELATMNSEMERRTSELDRLTLHYESILESVEVGVIVLDTKLTVTSWNAVASGMWGIATGDAVGRDFFSLALGELARRARAPLSEALEKRSREVLEHVPYSRDGGPQRSANVRFTPIVDRQSGAALGVIAVAIAENMPHEAAKTGEGHART